MRATTHIDFDPFAEAVLVVGELTDDQVLRYFGTDDRRQSVAMLAAERAIAGPATPTALAVLAPAQLGSEEHREGMQVRVESTRVLDRVVQVAKVSGLCCAATFLLLGLFGMAWTAMSENWSSLAALPDALLTGIAVIAGVAMVLAFVLLLVAQGLSRVGENRRRRAQLEWASWRPGQLDEPGQLGRGLPGIRLPEVMGGWNMSLNRLAAALVVLGVMACLVCGFLAYSAVKEQDWGMLVTGLLGLAPGVAAAWAGWKLPGWSESRARRDWELARALVWRG